MGIYFKTKDGLAPVLVNTDHKHDVSDVVNFPESLPANGGNSDTVNGLTVETAVPANAKFTDTTYGIATSDKTGLVRSGGDVTVDTDGTMSVADNSHKHTVSNISDFPTSMPASDVSAWAKATTKPTYTATEVGADPVGSANTVLTEAKSYATTQDETTLKSAKSYADTKDAETLASAKSYADKKVSDLINSAPTTLDTLGEIATAMQENADVVEALESAVGTKANASDLTSHTGNKSNPHGVTKAQVGLGNVENKSSATIRGELTKENVTDALGYTPSESDTVYSHPTSGVTAGTYRSVTVNAQGHVTAGSNPTITVAQGGTGATNVSAAAYNIFGDIRESTSVITDNTPMVAKYDTPSESAGVFHWRKASVIWEYIKGKISSILGLTDTQYNGNAKTATTATNATKVNNLTVETAVPANAKFTDTTYSNMTAATASAAGKAGLVPAPAAGKQTSFLRGDGTWVVPTNTTYSNFVKSGTGAKAGLVPAPSTTEGTTKYLREDGTWAVPPDTNTTYTLSSFGITATAAELNKLDGVTATATELNYVDGVTSNIQTQLNDKAASSHGTHVTFGTTAPAAAGTAAVGSATTVSRSDHVHPAQTTVSGNAGTATTLKTARTIDGVSFNGSAAITHYGTCSTAADTAAKTVALTGFSLVTGAIIFVKFTVTNTAASPTLNVNSTGAKAIMYRGSAISTGYLAANRVYAFVYDGTDWEFIGDVNTNTTYSVVSASANGLVPMFDAADGTIDSASTDWVLTNNNGTIGWFKLPANAFNNTTYSAATTSANGLMTSAQVTSLNGKLDKSGGTMTGALVAQTNTSYTTAQVRNVTMSTAAASGGTNGQIHYQYS